MPTWLFLLIACILTIDTLIIYRVVFMVTDYIVRAKTSLGFTNLPWMMITMMKITMIKITMMKIAMVKITMMKIAMMMKMLKMTKQRRKSKVYNPVEPISKGNQTDD